MGGVEKLLVITNSDYMYKEKDKIKRIFFTFIVQLVSANNKNIESVLQFKTSKKKIQQEINDFGFMELSNKNMLGYA